MEKYLKKDKRSCKICEVRKFYRQNSNGINAYIGTNIKQLSSGQKQRISIARSIYSDRDILTGTRLKMHWIKKMKKQIFQKFEKFKNKKNNNYYFT